MSEQDQQTPEVPEVKEQILWTNAITLLGLFVVAVGLILLVTFWGFRAITPEHEDSDYLNIIGYLILPGIFATGLALCPIGVSIRRWRYRRYGVGRQIPARFAIAFLGVSFFLTLPVLGISSYMGYHYTESSEFCGSCHSVMQPHFTVYQDSPHARVSCAECHIGSGASPFVKSKLSGIRQVFAVLTNSYPRPIPPSITQLRPARETCEECHWPEQFYGAQLMVMPRFSHKESNERSDLEILIKVGGANRQLGRAEGIHMHMLDRVEYISTDPNLQEIPWVEYADDKGNVTIYRSDGKPGSSPPPDGHLRRVDCMDCHNRVGHEFLSPEHAVDRAMNARQIDPSLPYIKNQSVIALATHYEDRESGLTSIRDAVNDYYAKNYPDMSAEQKQKLAEAIETLQSIYRTQFWPSMKTDWRVYPNNIGHMESPGCFRCHDGRHVSDDGKVITSDCMACHTFLTRKSPGSNVITEGTFSHDMKIHDLWRDFGPHRHLRCDQCHDGGTQAWGTMPVSENCGDCHESWRWLDQKGKEKFRATHPTPDDAQPNDNAES